MNNGQSGKPHDEKDKDFYESLLLKSINGLVLRHPWVGRQSPPPTHSLLASSISTQLSHLMESVLMKDLNFFTANSVKSRNVVVAKTGNECYY